MLFHCFLVFALWSSQQMAVAIASNELPTQNEPLLEAERSWETANLHHDVAGLESVLSPAFVQINEDGSVTPRNEAIKALAASANHPKDYKIENRQIQINGDTAVITAEYTETGQSPKGYYRVTLKIADIFRYSQGTWIGIVGYAHLVRLNSGQPNPLSLNEE